MAECWQPEFLFAVCQHNANAALKRDVGRRYPECRPAFSRPGFVTFKFDAPAVELERYANFSPLARRTCFSLGSVRGPSAAELARQAWSLAPVQAWMEGREVGGLHVWQRDQRPPGDRDFEPVPTPLSIDVRRTLLEAALAVPSIDAASLAPENCRRNRWVVDVVIVEPGEWWMGCHVAARRSDCWPGGVPALSLPDDAVSRAYLKMAEALWWSAMPIAHEEAVLELGCAPGGSAQALLDAGAVVIGVDPAEVDALVAAHPRFTHVRRRTTQLPRNVVKNARWLTADMNVAPSFTLDAVEAVVQTPGAAIRGMLLTCKLPQWELLDELDAWIERIRSWGYRDLRVRQLAFNRQEICIAALRSRAQRRVARVGRRRSRRDVRQSELPKPHCDIP